MDGRQPSLLLVTGADLGPFRIAEQRKIDGSWPVPLVELRWAAHIHQRTAQLPQLIDREVLGVSHA